MSKRMFIVTIDLPEEIDSLKLDRAICEGVYDIYSIGHLDIQVNEVSIKQPLLED